MRYCKTCLNSETRPRIIFNEDGKCNACIWADRKKSIDWNKRKQQLTDLCDSFRRDNDFDVIVPCSGGKDGSYVAWKLKHDFGMHPLCVTFSPPMSTAIGRQNLDNFRDSGFDLIEIRPNPHIYQRLCKKMFIEQARCKFPFVVGIATAVVQVAINFGIPFIIYGEEGETEYGGSDKYADELFMTQDYMKIYHEDNDFHLYIGEFTEAELKWWLLPPWEEINSRNLKITWWSKFEAWDDQAHKNLAIKECGLKTEAQIGTFTDYAQLDDILQDLHMYECFLKYGFGRATADCNLAIRAGRMTREEGLEIIRKHDGRFPHRYLFDMDADEYLKYFDMDAKAFFDIIDFWANKHILKRKVSGTTPYGLWILKEKAH